MTAHILDFPNKHVPDGVSRDFKRALIHFGACCDQGSATKAGEYIYSMVLTGELSPSEGALLDFVFGVEL